MELAGVDQVIDLLNEINRLDSTVLPALINYRVLCNKALADHPTVQVGYVDDNEDSGKYEVGLLGILNGLLGTDEKGWGHIYCHVSASNENGVVTIEKFGTGAHAAHQKGEAK